MEASISSLLDQEYEASANLADLRHKTAILKKSIHEKEDAFALQERELGTFSSEREQEIDDKKREGGRKISLAKSHLLSVEKALDDLIASHPQLLEKSKSDLIAIKAQYKEEIRLVQDKIAAMLERKRASVQDSSVRLSALQEDIVEVERQIDEARSRTILGGHRSKEKAHNSM